MKKAIAALLALTLAPFALGACHEGTDEPGPGQNPPSVTDPDNPDKPITPDNPSDPGDEYGTLSVCDTYAWLGADGAEYPATEFVLNYTKTPPKGEMLTYEYDKAVIELDENKHTVKALKAGSTTVRAESAHYSAEFKVTCEVIDKDTPDKAYNLYEHANGDLKGWDTRVRTFESEWDSVGINNSTTVFVGDSFFDQSGFWKSFYVDYAGKDVLCWGIGSTTTCSWETITDTLLYKTSPKNLVMHCGTNNVFDLHQSADVVVSSLERIFTLMHDRMPATKLYWFNITARYHGGATEGNAITAEINERLAEWAVGRKWLTVIDSRPKLGIFAITADGVHPNEDGYKIFMDELAASGIKINNK